MLRKLRIAFSVFSGLACLLLVALWVRSYWRIDSVRAPLPKVNVLEVDSFRGRFLFDLYNLSTYTPSAQGRNWRFTSDVLGDGTWDEEPAYPLYWYEKKLSWTHTLVVSDWFAVLVAAALAALPWLRWRYSLRTLLVVMTLIALLLATMPHLVQVKT